MGRSHNGVPPSNPFDAGQLRRMGCTPEEQADGLCLWTMHTKLFELAVPFLNPDALAWIAFAPDGQNVRFVLMQDLKRASHATAPDVPMLMLSGLTLLGDLVRFTFVHDHRATNVIEVVPEATRLLAHWRYKLVGGGDGGFDWHSRLLPPPSWQGKLPVESELNGTRVVSSRPVLGPNTAVMRSITSTYHGGDTLRSQPLAGLATNISPGA